MAAVFFSILRVQNSVSALRSHSTSANPSSSEVTRPRWVHMTRGPKGKTPIYAAPDRQVIYHAYVSTDASEYTDVKTLDGSHILAVSPSGICNYYVHKDPHHIITAKMFAVRQEFPGSGRGIVYVTPYGAEELKRRVKGDELRLEIVASACEGLKIGALVRITVVTQVLEGDEKKNHEPVRKEPRGPESFQPASSSHSFSSSSSSSELSTEFETKPKTEIPSESDASETNEREVSHQHQHRLPLHHRRRVSQQSGRHRLTSRTNFEILLPGELEGEGRERQTSPRETERTTLKRDEFEFKGKRIDIKGRRAEGDFEKRVAEHEFLHPKRDHEKQSRRERRHHNRLVNHVVVDDPAEFPVKSLFSFPEDKYSTGKDFSSDKTISSDEEFSSHTSSHRSSHAHLTYSDSARHEAASTSADTTTSPSESLAMSRPEIAAESTVVMQTLQLILGVNFAVIVVIAGVVGVFIFLKRRKSTAIKGKLERKAMMEKLEWDDGDGGLDCGFANGDSKTYGAIKTSEDVLFDKNGGLFGSNDGDFDLVCENGSSVVCRPPTRNADSMALRVTTNPFDIDEAFNDIPLTAGKRERELELDTTTDLREFNVGSELHLTIGGDDWNEVWSDGEEEVNCNNGSFQKLEWDDEI